METRMPPAAVRAWSWAPALSVATLLVLGSRPSSAAEPLTSQQLCTALTSQKVNAATASSERKAIPHKVYGCKYQHPTQPTIYLKNSSAKTEEEYIERSRNLEGEVRREPGGIVLVSFAFDIQKQKISEAWFQLRGTPVQLGFSVGIEPEKALALIRAARN
jgi:hypothetical protein